MFSQTKQATSFLESKSIKSFLNINYGGRHSNSGIIATIFGATGFLGGYVVNNLGAIGSQCIIPFRGEESSYNHLKVLGDIGKIVPIRIDIRDPDTIKETTKHSNVVINFLGKAWETRNFNWEEANVQSAKTIAEASRGADRFIHMSVVGADPDSPSAYLAAKGRAEKVVKKIIPDATIVRATTVIGDQDKFINKFGYQARYFPRIPVYSCLERKIQPLSVVDLSYAITNIIGDDSTKGKTFELGGPRTYNMAEVYQTVWSSCQYDTPKVMLLGDKGMSLWAKIGQNWPNPFITPDEVIRLQIDDIVPKDAKYTMAYWPDLPKQTTLEQHVLTLAPKFIKPAQIGFMLSYD